VTAVTYLGMTADPDELRSIAQAVDAGEDGWLDRVTALPGYLLTRETMASPPGVVAERLRQVAGFLERRRDGVPFGGHEYAARIAAQIAAIREKNKDRPFTFAGRRRRM